MVDVTVNGTPGAAGINGVDPGASGTLGGNGGDAVAVNNGNGTDQTNRAIANGGNGGLGGKGAANTKGTGGAGGDGGHGGDADATTTVALNSTLDVTVRAYGNGGGGGNGGRPGNYATAYAVGKGSRGGDGGDGTAAATATNTLGAARAYATTKGGNGGRAYMAPYIGGAGGIASATTATAHGKTATASVYQQGGTGGAGFGGANGGAGRDSALLDAVAGSVTTGPLTLRQVAIGGAGGYADGAVGGAAGNATSKLSHSFTGGTSTSSTTGSALATAGKGGGGATAQDGGIASAAISLVGAHAVTATAQGQGGEGGASSVNGNGGDGGFASASSEATTSSTSARATSKANAYGGRGGNAAGAGRTGGAGGTGQVQFSKATGRNAYVDVRQNGGNGGDGQNGASGGAGGESKVNNAASATSTGGTIGLDQRANGGQGGYATGATPGNGGDGGYASSKLVFNDATANPTKAVTLNGLAGATGGGGGRGNASGHGGAANALIDVRGANTVYGLATSKGGIGGYAVGGPAGQGGQASANATAVSYATNKTAKAVANLYGGSGGTASGAGQAGGAGGGIGIGGASAYANGFDATANVQAIGGRGGSGRVGADGGAGGTIELTDTVSAVTSGGPMSLTQLAKGGVGGASDAAIGGAGGKAVSRLSFNDVTVNSTDASQLSGRVEARGGDGGSGRTTGGAGGNATASVNLTAFNVALAVATATAGNGGGINLGGNGDGASGGTVEMATARAYSTGGNYARAEATAEAGHGGSANGAGKTGGAGGSVSGSGVGAFARGGNVTVKLSQTGGSGGAGSGGAGSGGAGGGSGAESVAVDKVSGVSSGASLSLTQFAYGGDGGRSDNALGGNGARGVSTLKFVDTANPTQAGTLTGQVTAIGGDGGFGFAAGAAAEGRATVDLTGKNAVRAYGSASGGNGGTVLTGGKADGAQGAYATAIARGVSSNGAARAFATAQGGSGGDGRGSTKRGGAGGEGKNGSAHAFGSSAYAKLTDTAGRGGYGAQGASGGAGGASVLVDAVTGGSTGGYVRLRQYANAGNGGGSATQAGGAGGKAQSSLSFNDIVANTIAASTLTGSTRAVGGASGTGRTTLVDGGAADAVTTVVGARKVDATASATGGAGGSARSGSLIGGADGGAATALADARTTSITEAASATARSYGGTGGYTRAPGQVGGAGGVASTTTAFASGRTVTAYALQEGGRGGTGTDKSSGGDGADSTLVNAVAGETSGGRMYLRQLARGGAGGYGQTGGGNGGDSSSSLTFNDATANLIDASYVRGQVIARGGAGGGAPTGKNGGAGGAGSGFAEVTAERTVNAQAYAYGGAGGGAGGAGGNGMATAIGRSIGTVATSTATATATAIGGAGGTAGAATANARAITALGQAALATANASGASGVATAEAQTNTNTLVTRAEASATSEVDGAVDSHARANATVPNVSFLSGTFNSYALVTAVPNAAFINAALNANTTVKTELGTPLATVFATGTQGAAYGGGGLRSYGSITTWTINTLTLSGDLILGLLDRQTLGTGFTTLSLSVTIDDVGVFSQAFNTVTDANALTAAQAFFDDEVVNLGDVANVEALRVSVSYTLTAATAGAGFGMHYVLGTTNDEIDDTPPPKPGTPDLIGSSDSGRLNDDNLTNATRPSLTGVTEAAATVRVFDGVTSLGTTKANAAGQWTFVVPNDLGAGVHAITVKATDAAGNTSVASDPLTVTIDVTPPATPTAPDLEADSDLGRSDSDDVTSDNTPGFAGVTEANATVRLLRDGGIQIGQTVADAAGKWSLVPAAALPDQTYAITVVAIDAAGNESAPSEGLTVTIDTVAPATPTAPDLVPISDSGASPTDNLTNATSTVFRGVAEANATVLLFDGATQVGSGLAKADGAWSIKSNTLGAGVHTISARAVDQAGNTGPSSAGLSVTVDRTAPDTPTALNLVVASDTGASNTDDVTQDDTPTITGRAATGTVVTLFDGATAVGSANTNAAGAWAITTSELGDGQHALTAVAVDVAGNTSAASAVLAVTVDTIAVTPSMPDLADKSDTGVSNTDNITRQVKPVFSGSAEAGATVTLKAGTNILGIGKADALTGAWSITVGALAAGRPDITAESVDLAGNVSAISAALQVTIDVTAPAAAASAPDLLATSDTGASATDNLTRDTTPTFSGTAPAGAIVTLMTSERAVGSATANAKGGWTITTEPLSDGPRAFIARASDIAGNNAPSSPRLVVTIDSSALPPSVDLTAASDTGRATTDNITRVTTPTFTGIAEGGASVTLFAGTVQIGQTTASALGAWSIASGELADGSYMIKARQTDILGNVSALSAGLRVTIDTQAPAAPGRADLITTSDTGASFIDNITRDTTPTFSAKSETGATLEFLDGATVIGSIRAGTATQSFTAPVLTEGQHQIRVRAIDAAGNVSAQSSELAVVIDTTVAAPTRPDLKDTSDKGVSPTDNITNSNRPVFTGDAEAGATVSLFDGATVVGTGKATSTGAWSIQTTLLTDGAHAISAQAVDPAGNISAMSKALSVTIDTVRPVAPSDLDLLAASDSGASASDNVTSDVTPILRGKAAAGSLVKLTTQNGAALTELGTATANGVGIWTITTPTLVDGFYFFKASATDAAGNLSLASAELQVQIDTAAPPPPVITRAFIQPGGAVSPVVLVNGESEAGATVTLSEDGTVLGTVNSGGLWQIGTALSPGQHMLTAVAVDPAGNASGPSVTRTVEIGTSSNDTLLGTAGADFLNGWKGDDTYMVNHAGDVVTEHEFDGSDTVLASVGYTLDLDSRIEFLAAAPGAAGLALAGNNFANMITGGAGDDVITGRGGADVLEGGLGADVFALLALSDSTSASSGRDTIVDFSILEGDLIGLGALDANALLAGDQPFTFVGAAAFSAAGQVRAEVIGGDTIVSGNVNASLSADFAIRLTGAHTLSGANFIP